MNYRKIWEENNKACLVPGIHVHHKDGNRDNNSIENLIAVTPEEHYDIHWKQGDYGACTLLKKNCLGQKRPHDDIRKEMGEEAYRKWQASHLKGKKRTKQQRENHKRGAAKRLANPQYIINLKKSITGIKRKPTRKDPCEICGKLITPQNMKRHMAIH